MGGHSGIRKDLGSTTAAPLRLHISHADLHPVAHPRFAIVMVEDLTARCEVRMHEDRFALIRFPMQSPE